MTQAERKPKQAEAAAEAARAFLEMRQRLAPKPMAVYVRAALNQRRRLPS